MNKYIIILCLALSASCTTFQYQPTCHTQNQFLATLHSSVVLLPTPSKESNKCGGEWRTFGTCCQEASLLKFTNQEKEKIFSSAKKVISSVEKYSNDLFQLGDLYKAKSVRFHAEQFLKWSEGYKKFDSGQTTAKNTTERTQMFYIVLDRIFKNDFAENFIENVTLPIRNGQFRKSTVRCWEKMFMLRTASHCSACSGRAAAYFNNDKMRIAQDTCQSVMTECSDSFRTLFIFYNGMGEIGNHVLNSQWSSKKNTQKLFATSKLATEFKENMRGITQVTESIKQHHLQSIVDSYFRSHGEQSASIEKILCSKLISLSKKTLIEELSELVVYDTELINAGIHSIKAYEEKMVREFLKNSPTATKRSISNFRMNYYQANAKDVLRKTKDAIGNRNSGRIRIRETESIAFKVQGRNDRSGSSKPATSSNKLLPKNLPKKRKLTVQVFRDLSLFAGDVAVVPPQQKKADSSYVSFFGATGTAGSEASVHMPKLVLNLTMHFP